MRPTKTCAGSRRFTPSSGSRASSVAAAIGHLEVVLPVARGPGELELALEGVGAERGGVALVESRGVAPDAQHAVVDRDPVGPAHAARVEVLHDEPVAGLGGADDADPVGEQLVLVV